MQAVKRIGWLFIISSVANIAWIFSWHYLIIPLSLVLMLVIFWAYIGILIKHVGADGFNGQYTSVIVTVSIFIAIIAIAIVATLIKAKKQTKE